MAVLSVYFVSIFYQWPEATAYISQFLNRLLKYKYKKEISFD